MDGLGKTAACILQAVCVFVGAGVGAVLRWRIGVWLATVGPSVLTGTMAVNVLGSFLIGIVAGILEARAHLPPEARLLLATGFLGGFTTFSAFSLEAADLLSSRPFFGSSVIIGKLIVCILLTYCGLYLGKIFLK